tara:strand:+ start:5523 stop:6443 length:921 start_codon:yes stop_codon:yes gene_type:complete
MNLSDRNKKISEKFKTLHGEICKKFLPHENEDFIVTDDWEKKKLGQGRTVVIDGGKFFNKAGINFSSISGERLPESSVGTKSESTNMPFFATGVSVVFHPNNPNIPTAHFNVRYFCTFKNNGVFEEWFGGGFDLTPYVLFEEDCVLWHKNAKKACEVISDDTYNHYKKNCDNYFYLPHRQEHRGVGGLFYEKKKFSNVDEGIDFSDQMRVAFVNSFSKIIDKRKDLPFDNKLKDFQRFRRGRYVEFNLVYDRGTLFGLQSGGRIESILMSLPNEVSWRYKYDSILSPDQQKLYEVLKKPRDWAHEK